MANNPDFLSKRLASLVAMMVFCIAQPANAQPRASDTPPAEETPAAASKNMEMLDLPELPAANGTASAAAPHVPATSGSNVPPAIPSVAATPATPFPSTPSFPSGAAAVPPVPVTKLPPAAVTPPPMPDAAGVPPNMAKGPPAVPAPVPSIATVVPPAAAGSAPSAASASATDYDPNTTLMFSADDMYKIEQMLKLYDSYESHQTSSRKDDLSDLFGNQSLPPGETPVLPNLYLGSIVYYSPANWSVTLNGKIVLSSDNAPGKEFYVSKISRKEAEIVWKPAAIDQVYDIWNQVTGDGKNLPDKIMVDRMNGFIKLRMRPNQTLVIRELAIREGLIKPESVPNDKEKAAASSLIPALPKISEH